MSIDLKPFCSTDENRDYLLEPFSLGDHTYASDGRVLVRVARCNDVPPRGGKRFRERFAKLIATLDPRWINVASFAPIPEPSAILHWPEKKCSTCEGEDCSMCDGSGVIREAWHVARFAEQDLNVYYLDLIRALPGVLMAFGNNCDEPAAFRFDGGVGCIMPMRTRDTPAPQQSVEAAA